MKLNAGCGSRQFDRAQGWTNLDISPACMPDIVADWRDLSMFGDRSMEYVVSHHSIEHVGCNEAAMFISEAHRVLVPGGSLLIFVPNLRALAQRFLIGQMDTQLYMTNVFGPYDGTEGSRHRWGYTPESMREFIEQNALWMDIRPFNWRPIPGADIAKDWHIIGMEATK